jgi:type II protein arginine methyltransferase
VDAYARAVNACLKSIPFITLSIRLPPYDPSIFRTRLPTTNSRFSFSLAGGTTPASPSAPALDVPALRSPDGDLNATWEMWDIIRSICDYNPRLTLSAFSCASHVAVHRSFSALDLTPPLPSTLGALSRWAAESVRFIYLPSSTFIANNKGYPVLPKGTQSFIRDSVAASAVFDPPVARC